MFYVVDEKHNSSQFACSTHKYVLYNRYHWKMAKSQVKLIWD